MATYKVRNWQEIPSQVNAEDFDYEVSLPLRLPFEAVIECVVNELRKHRESLRSSESTIGEQSNSDRPKHRNLSGFLMQASKGWPLRREFTELIAKLAMKRAELEALVKAVEYCRLKTQPRFFDFFVEGRQFKHIESLHEVAG
jgi:hypothetical protein